jgi:hypothetical protein
VPSIQKLARVAAQLAATRKALERQLEPPVGRFQRALAFLAHRGFAVSLVITAALVFGLLSIGGGAVWLAWLRLVIGVILIVEGLLLATDWRGARRLTIWRMRRGETGGVQLPLTHRVVRVLASPGLQLLGIAWLGAGVLAAAVGLPKLV